MTLIKDKVSVQMYGDREVQNAIIELLKDGGLVAKDNREGKEYKTKRGDEGYYMSVTFKYPEDVDEE